jgi:CheY-like chemotaxis protein
LTLTKSFVEMHGGRLEARSDGLGLGSEFLVYLPTSCEERVAPTQPEQARQSAASHRRILIVDDSRSASFVLGKLLEKLGHEVRAAVGAASAMEIACSNWPDLVISDIAMPTIDGYEFARRLRKEPSLATLPLVALSGYGQDTDKQQSKEAGFDYHLVKPVSLETLTDLIASLPPLSLR